MYSARDSRPADKMIRQRDREESSPLSYAGSQFNNNSFSTNGNSARMNRPKSEWQNSMSQLIMLGGRRKPSSRVSDSQSSFYRFHTSQVLESKISEHSVYSQSAKTQENDKQSSFDWFGCCLDKTAKSQKKSQLTIILGDQQIRKHRH